MLQKLVISYRTSPDLPAPHSYQAELELVPDDMGLLVVFHRDYLERDMLEKQDIVAEGFTDDDDFVWTGRLSEIWKREVLELVGRSQLLAREPRQLHLMWEAEEKLAGSPEPESEWLLLTEQLIQACLEAGGKELPMELVLGKLEKNNFFEKGRLVWFFERKELIGQILEGAEKIFGQEEWTSSQQQLRKWIEKEAQQNDLFQIPSHKGLFWLLNGEVWLPYGSQTNMAPLHWVEDQLGM
ncbi:MAG TPA: hypothetical protein PKY12_06755 [Catalimonadaceae bacterium]|jgi:hypothetical protein|nr:hypothetical protein [Catalimonadaceae bacterium]